VKFGGSILLTSPLIVASIFARIKGTALRVGKFSCWGLGIAFIFFSIGHVVNAEGMVEMLPAWVPLRLSIIYFTGVLELFIGLALFFPKYQINAAKAAVVVFIIFFPANIYAAINGVGLGGHQWGAIYLLIRLPLQLILIAWAYYLCIKISNTSIQPAASVPKD
jgi:uncharacterized membrane protein